ncbi:MAG: SRPBCC domain-containing protein [Hyphomicrobiaceae bacterium]|nr:SRPBCC domain-containing protein [Hyphomicrobiaceae bacterium]
MSAIAIGRRLKAPRPAVYRALLDARAVAAWRVPDGMTCHVHEFNPREGGRFRVSLTYDKPTEAGKTSANTDTYHGVFAKLVANEQVVEVVEFETNDPAMQGVMRIVTTLADADGGTDILMAFEGLPRGIREVDNEIGTRMALGKLAALVETGSG